jgi:hypothetical protein
MRNFASKSGWNIGGEATTTKGGDGGSRIAATITSATGETQPLIGNSTASAASYIQSSSNNNNSNTRTGGHIRERRPSRSSTPTSMSSNTNTKSQQQHQQQQQQQQYQEPTSSYTRIQDDVSSSGGRSVDEQSGTSYQSAGTTNRSLHSLQRRSYLVEKAAREATGTTTPIIMGGGSSGFDHPPLLEIPEEIYGVRKAALQVLKPLTRTWVSLHKVEVFFENDKYRFI